MAAVAAPDRVELNINDDGGPAPLIPQQPVTAAATASVRQPFFTAFCTMCCPHVACCSVTYLIFWVNVVVFAITANLGEGDNKKFACVLYNAGAIDSYDLKYNFQIYRLFTHMFLHGSLEHLLGNMLFLWLFGFEVEKYMGHLPYLVMYLVGGIFAGFAQTALVEGLGLGASGAITTIVGYILVYTFAILHDTQEPYYKYMRLVLLILFEMFLPADGVGNYAHIGGALIGILAAFKCIDIKPESYLKKDLGLIVMKCIIVAASVGLLAWFIINPVKETIAAKICK